MGTPSKTAVSILQATIVGMKKIVSLLAAASTLLLREVRGLTDSQKILMGAIRDVRYYQANKPDYINSVETLATQQDSPATDRDNG